MEHADGSSINREKKKKVRKERGIQKRTEKKETIQQSHVSRINSHTFPKLDEFLNALDRLQITCKLKDIDSNTGIFLKCKHGKNIMLQCTQSIEINVLDIDISSCTLFCKVVANFNIPDDALSYFCIRYTGKNLKIQLLSHKIVSTRNIQNINHVLELNIPKDIKGLKDIKYSIEENHFLKPASKAFHKYVSCSGYNARKVIRRYCGGDSRLFIRPYDNDIMYGGKLHVLQGNLWFEVNNGVIDMVDELSIQQNM